MVVYTKPYFSHFIESKGTDSVMYSPACNCLTPPFDKVSLITNNILNNLEFKKQQVKSDHHQNERLEMVRQTIALTEKIAFEERLGIKASKKTKVKKEKSDSTPTKKTKEPKPDTKEASFSLYKQGKTIFEIAEARGFALTTIEGHLAHYVSLGMIPVSNFVAKEKFDVIVNASKKIESENKLTPLKLELGDDYSYSEIRFSLATQKHLKKE